MDTASIKSARMELKTTAAAKDLLTMAAALEGMDLTSFVLVSNKKNLTANMRKSINK